MTLSRVPTWSSLSSTLLPQRRCFDLLLNSYSISLLSGFARARGRFAAVLNASRLVRLRHGKLSLSSSSTRTAVTVCQTLRGAGAASRPRVSSGSARVSSGQLPTMMFGFSQLKVTLRRRLATDIGYLAVRREVGDYRCYARASLHVRTGLARASGERRRLVRASNTR